MSEEQDDDIERVAVVFHTKIPDPELHEIQYANHLQLTRDHTSDMVQFHFAQYTVPHIRNPRTGQIVEAQGRHVARIVMPLKKVRSLLLSLEKSRAAWFSDLTESEELDTLPDWAEQPEADSESQ